MHLYRSSKSRLSALDFVLSAEHPLFDPRHVLHSDVEVISDIAESDLLLSVRSKDGSNEWNSKTRKNHHVLGYGASGRCLDRVTCVKLAPKNLVLLLRKLRCGQKPSKYHLTANSQPVSV